jgi:hypothetical protein
MLLLDDFRDRERLRLKEQELSGFMLPAVQMYTGRQHCFLREGLDLLRTMYGHGCIDLKILSAGYGLLDEEERIAPYNVSFSEMKSSEITEWALQLEVKEKLEQILVDYDLVFFLLGDSYLRALSLPVVTEERQKLVFITGWSCAELIPDLENYLVVGTAPADATSFGSALVSLKGRLFKLFCMEAVKDPDVLSRVFSDPEYLHCLLYRHRKEVREQCLNLFNEAEIPSCEEILAGARQTAEQYRRKFAGFIIKEKYLADNYRAGKQIRFFMPEWNDRVDPDYDFSGDLHMRGEKTPYEHDQYAHEIFPTPNYDGILVSLAVLDNGKKEQIGQDGIHRFLRFSEDRPVMADCGAFNYIAMEEPPFTTAEVLESYETLGFNFGVSIDHLIVGDFQRDPIIKRKRYEMTQRNAEEFINLYRAGKYSFKPIGVAQGWDPPSYRASVKKLIDHGYDYIALGSLIPKTSRQIYEIMRTVAPVLPEYIDVHLFGITRTEGIRSFHQLGATSFDSAGPLRQAWLSARSNYYSMERIEDSEFSSNGYKKYAAIRIPFVNPKYLPDSLVRELAELEQAALAAVRIYGKRQTDIADALHAVATYEKNHNDARFIRLENKLISEKKSAILAEEIEKLRRKKAKSELQLGHHKELYREVLEKRPWEKCDCTICREIGIEVIIFRGNNRNRRRGFHNTYIFNRQYRLAVSGDNNQII